MLSQDNSFGCLAELRDVILSARPLLLKLSEDEDRNVRSAAVTALCNFAKHCEF
jgi:hypothetical protein